MNNNKFSANWKDLGSVLVYQPNNFQFNRDIIITEFEDCLIKKISKKKLYDAYTEHSIDIYDADFIKRLSKQNANIVVLSNQLNTSKLNIDMIKTKFETLLNIIKIPIIAFFSLRPNNFMKPHTGMWKLLLAYYHTNQCNINNCVVVSNLGSVVMETDKKEYIAWPDTDRAFAHNIGVDFKTINEFLNEKKKEKFKWNNRVIQPNVRTLYSNEIARINKEEKPSILKELMALASQQSVEQDTFIIIVYGAPRSGKTTFINQLIKKWNGSEFSKNHVITYITPGTQSHMYRQFVKNVSDRISVVIEDHKGVYNVFSEYARVNQMGILYINIDCGIEMAKVFNHVCVEEAKDENTELYPNDAYIVYRSCHREPRLNNLDRSISICVEIDPRDTVMKFVY